MHKLCSSNYYFNDNAFISYSTYIFLQLQDQVMNHQPMGLVLASLCIHQLLCSKLTWLHLLELNQMIWMILCMAILKIHCKFHQKWQQGLQTAGAGCRVTSVVAAFAAAVEKLELQSQQWLLAQSASKLFVSAVLNITIWFCGQMLVLA